MKALHMASPGVGIVLILISSIGHLDAQEYVTILRTVSVNGRSINESAWKKGIEIRPEDYIEWVPAVRSAAGDTMEAASYLIELRYDSITHHRTIIEPRIEYKGLQAGDYTLRIQAQMPAAATVSPLLLRFRVGSHLSLSDGESDLPPNVTPSPADSLTAFPLQLWIVLALATSAVSLVLVALLLRTRRRTKHTMQDVEQLRHQLETAQQQIELLERQRQRAEEELTSIRTDIANRLAQSEEHNRQLRQQNHHLRQQVERLRAAKQQLQALQEEKDALFSMILHDIKNPLLVIESLVQLLRHYDSNSTEMQQILSDLAETTSRIVALSQQVSRLLAIEQSDRIGLHFEQTNLTDIIRSVTHRNTYLARRKNIQIIEELPPHLIAECDPQRIEEVFDNVLSNAIKYSHEGTIVIIRANNAGDHHIIEIEDHGVGMTSEDLQHLFERGVQLSSKPTAGESSSGIGLWIVRRIVEHHHGTISVQSTKGKGTTVRISLPITQPTSVEEHIP